MITLKEIRARRRAALEADLCFVCQQPVPRSEGVYFAQLRMFTHLGCGERAKSEWVDRSVSKRGRRRSRGELLARLDLAPLRGFDGFGGGSSDPRARLARASNMNEVHIPYVLPQKNRCVCQMTHLQNPQNFRVRMRASAGWLTPKTPRTSGELLPGHGGGNGHAGPSWVAYGARAPPQSTDVDQTLLR